MDEQALIAAAVRGELRAFNQLLQHHQALAYNVAYRMLDDTDAAADAVEEAAIKAAEAEAQGNKHFSHFGPSVRWTTWPKTRTTLRRWFIPVKARRRAPCARN